jgi:hypothetical protein
MASFLTTLESSHDSNELLKINKKVKRKKVFIVSKKKYKGTMT